MNHCMDCLRSLSVGIVLGATLFASMPVNADEAKAVKAVKLDPSKLAGINLPAEEQFMDPEDVLEGNHRPRGEVLHYGEQLIVEVYEDDPATFLFDDPFIYDEFVTILSGKLILTGPDGVSQEFVAGESLVIPKGFSGTYQMLGNYRELIVIDREPYEEEYGAPAE